MVIFAISQLLVSCVALMIAQLTSVHSFKSTNENLEDNKKILLKPFPLLVL